MDLEKNFRMLVLRTIFGPNYASFWRNLVVFHVLSKRNFRIIVGIMLWVLVNENLPGEYPSSQLLAYYKSR